MTQDEADQQARQLYGHTARAQVNAHNGLLDIVIMESHGLSGVDMLLGWGDTWKEALSLAAKRTALPLIRECLEHEYSLYTNPSQIEMF